MLEKIFIAISGANQEILNQPECQPDRSKYAMIGVAILCTAILAALSGGYALFTIFESLEIAIALGGFYGAMIANLDRFLVASTKKEEHFTASQGINLGIRLTLAILIGLVISKPLELKCFQKYILAEIALKNQEILAETEAKLTKKFSEIEALQQQIKDLQKEVQDRQQIRDNAFQDAMAENDGTQGTLKPGKGPVFSEKYKRFQALDREYQALLQSSQEDIKKIRARIDDLNAQKEQEYAQVKTTQEQAIDFVSQLQTLEHLAAKDPVINHASWAITLLLITLDTAPILAKMFLKRGIYDVVLESKEKAIIDNQKRKLTNAIKQNRLQENFNYEQMIASYEAATNKPKLQEVNNQLAELILEQYRQESLANFKKVKGQLEKRLSREVKDLEKASIDLQKKWRSAMNNHRLN